ncbi:MAG: glycosyltransferase family protein [Magnetococcales bacterium]|nr:glycosyltransferase family protein [Magnetococcales bacterium]
MPCFFDQVSALLSAGEAAEALVAARLGLAQEPDHAPLLNLAAICAVRTGELAAAEGYWRRALVLAPDGADMHNNLGILLHDRQRFDEGEAFFRTALRLRPDYPEACLNLGNLLQTRKRYREAEEAYREALRLRPDFVEAYSNLGSLLHGEGRLVEAEAALQQALRLRSDDVDASNNYGNLLEKLECYDEAETCFLQAVCMRPEQVVGYLNLGGLYDKQRRYPEAITAYLEALRRRPQDADALFFLSLTLLSQGRFAEGWPLYENRYNVGKKEPILLLPDLPFPQWRGEDLNGKSLLVLQEQGYGDEIQFCRFLPLLKALGVKYLTVVCKKPLLPLFAEGLAVDRVLTQDDLDVDGMPQHDAWTLLLSIPLHLGITLDNLPATLPYLHPSPERMAWWAERMPQGGCRVGLVWQGNPGHLNDAHRSLPGLATLAPLWQVPGVVLISLQTGLADRPERVHLPGQPVVDLGAQVRDFADTAAIVAQLDLVIGVDTAVLHLAGALGKPAWVMLPCFGTDWRWLEPRPDSPWYPGVMRLFWQERSHVWGDVVEEVRAALQAFVPARQHA